MKTTGLQLAERLFGKPLSLVLRIFTVFSKKDKIHAGKDKLKNILVIRTGGLGDGILSIPFLEKLKSSAENCRITVACIKRNKVVFDGLPYVRRLVVIDDFTQIFSNLEHTLISKYDVIFDLEPIYRLSTVLSFLIGAKIKVGFDTDGRRDFYTHFVNYNQADYEADNFLRQLKIFGINSESAKGRLAYPLRKEHMTKAEAIVEKSGIEYGRDFLVGLSVGTLNEQNRWPTEKLCELSRKIANFRNNAKIVLIGGREDLYENAKLLLCLKNHGLGQKAVDLAGKTDFHTSIALLKYCDLFIGHDAGPLHMAVSAGTPTISFFGSAIESRWNPGGEGHVGLNKNYHCSPCRRGRFSRMPKCPYHYACIRDITVDEVFAAFKSLFTGLENDAKRRVS